MIYWNYRVVEHDTVPGGLGTAVHEVHYNDAGEVVAWAEESVKPWGEDLDSLRCDLVLMLAALRKPVLKASELPQ